jgi:Fe-S cluster assembly ATP-binding protein
LKINISLLKYQVSFYKSTESMLEIKNLTSAVQWKNILENIDMSFEVWKNYCILGENGSWKSSLALTIMWHPKYEITNWEIIVDWQKINEFTPDQKAKLWIFLAFQNIPEIPWIKLFEFLRTIYNNSTWENLTFLKFKNFIVPYMDEIWLDSEFLRRDLNVWFSWWEKRKIELLQIKLLKPKYIFLDEIDSWLDVDAFKSISKSIQELNDNSNCFIFITHHFEIINNIDIDEVYVLKDGKVEETWNKALIEKIKEKWFK